MEEKSLSTPLPEILNALTEQQKEQLAACRTAEELIALLGELGAEIPDALLDSAAGGYEPWDHNKHLKEYGSPFCYYLHIPVSQQAKYLNPDGTLKH